MMTFSQKLIANIIAAILVFAAISAAVSFVKMEPWFIYESITGRCVMLGWVFLQIVTFNE